MESGNLMCGEWAPDVQVIINASDQDLMVPLAYCGKHCYIAPQQITHSHHIPYQTVIAPKSTRSAGPKAHPSRAKQAGRASTPPPMIAVTMWKKPLCGKCGTRDAK